MSDRWKSHPRRHYEPASSSDGRNPLDRIRSLERRRNKEWKREQLRLEEGLQRSEASMSIGERVRTELKKLQRRTTEDQSDEGDSESEDDARRGGNPESEDDARRGGNPEREDGVRRGGNPGVGILWRMSFWATMSLFAHVFLNGPRIQANFVPDIVERDPIPRITRPRTRRALTNRLPFQI